MKTRTFVILPLIILSHYLCNCQKNDTQINNTIDTFDIWKYTQEWELSLPFWTSVFHSFVIVFISEIADKTFIIILLFSHKNSQVNIFFASAVAILGMNIFSVIIGFTIDQLLYRTIVDWIAFFVLICYGISILSEAWEMSSRKVEDKYVTFIEDEFKKKKKEQQQTNFEKSEKKKNNILLDEEAKLMEPMIVKDEITESKNPTVSKNEAEEEEESNFQTIWILVSAIVAAECGDKSQVSTIIISSVFNIYGVLVGSSLALLICVFLNVYYGHKLANYISEKYINYLFGTILLLVSMEIFLIKLNYINYLK